MLFSTLAAALLPGRALAEAVAAREAPGGEAPRNMERELWDENTPEEFIWNVERNLSYFHGIKDTLRKFEGKSCFLFRPVGEHSAPAFDDAFRHGEGGSAYAAYGIPSDYKALFLAVSDRSSPYGKVKYVAICDGEIAYGESYIVSRSDKGIVFDSWRDACAFRKTLELSRSPALAGMKEATAFENLKQEIRTEKAYVEKSVTDQVLAQAARIQSVEPVCATEGEARDFAEAVHQLAPGRVGDGVAYIGFDRKIFGILVSPYLPNGSLTGDLGDALGLWFRHIQELANDPKARKDIGNRFGEMVIGPYFFRKTTASAREGTGGGL